jgi:hypothetical protein
MSSSNEILLSLGESAEKNSTHLIARAAADVKAAEKTDRNRLCKFHSISARRRRRSTFELLLLFANVYGSCDVKLTVKRYRAGLTTCVRCF